MEPSRIVAAALFVVCGLVLVLYVMANARERSGSAGTTALAGVITLVVFLLLTVLVLTVLPMWLTWALVVVSVVTVTVMAVSN